MKSSFLEKLVERLDLVEPGEVQALVERLTREKGFMESVFAVLREGLVVLDPELVVTYLNPAAGKVFGLNHERSIGQPMDELVRGLSLEGIARPDKVVSRDMEIYYPENRFLNFYISPLSGTVEEKEEHLGYVMLIHDLTKTRRDTAEAIESEKLNVLTFLAAGVAHEIGNPLNSLNIHLQLMQRKVRKLSPGDRSALEKHLNTATGEIERLDGILRQFLQAIRPGVPERQPTQLHAVLKETLTLLAPELKARKVSVELDLADPLPLLQLDADQIKQALFNLLKNSFQAMSAEGGNIQISSRKSEYEITLEISDDGPGISAEVMGALFEPFRTTKAEGTGLGLLIVRRIVREHGGEIEMDSREGEGTRVTLFFPIGERPARMLGVADEVIDVS